MENEPKNTELKTSIMDLNKTTLQLNKTNLQIAELEQNIEIMTAPETAKLKEIDEIIFNKTKTQRSELDILYGVKLKIENEILNEIPENKKFQNVEGDLFQNFKAKDREIVNTVEIKKLKQDIEDDKVRIIENVGGSFGVNQFHNVDLFKISASAPRLKIVRKDKDLI